MEYSERLLTILVIFISDRFFVVDPFIELNKLKLSNFFLFLVPRSVFLVPLFAPFVRFSFRYFLRF